MMDFLKRNKSLPEEKSHLIEDASHLQDENKTTTTESSKGHIGFKILLVGVFVLVVGIVLFSGKVLTLLSQHTPFNHRTGTTLYKPLYDTNKYKFVELDNGMKVMLISTEEAGASICVHAGSGQDYPGYAGLAHYTEHSIFSGSKHYKSPGYLVDFVDRNGGVRNAYTSTFATVYYMTVDPSQFDKGLNVFSDMFKYPLWNQTHINKEKNSVQSEYEISQSSVETSYILDEVINAMTPEKHPLNRFILGSKKLFDEKNYIPKIKKFYRQYYTSDMMGAVVAAPLPLSKLLNITLEELNAVPGEKRDVPPQFFSNPYPKGYAGKESWGHFDSPSMKLSFVLAWSKATMEKYRPYLKVVEHIFALSGEGSFEQKLSSKRLAYYVYATATETSGVCTTFDLNFHLTASGFCLRKHIIHHLNSYVAYLKDNVDKIGEMWTSYRDLETFKFNHKLSFNLKSTLSSGCENLLFKNRRRFLSPPASLGKVFDPTVLTEFLSLLKPRNMVIASSAGKHDKCLKTMKGVKQYNTFYHFHYQMRSIPSSWFKQWAQVVKRPNKYKLFAPHFVIPKNLTIVPVTEPYQYPQAISVRYGFKGFWEQLSSYPSISASVVVYLGREITPIKDVIVKILVMHTNDVMKKLRPFGSTVGVSYETRSLSNALYFYWSSYSELEIVTDIARHLIDTALAVNTLTSKTFKQLKDKVEDVIDGGMTGTELFYYIVNGDAIATKDTIKVLNELSFKAFLKTAKHLFSEAAAKSIITGNLNRKQAENITRCIRGHIETHATLADGNIGYKRALVLPHGMYVIQRHRHGLSNHVQIFWQLTPETAYLESLRNTIMAKILNMLIHGQAYPELRSRQQIGYTVKAWSFNQNEVDYMTFIAKGSRYSADEMTYRMFQFLKHMFRDYLEKCIKHGTEEHRTGEEWFRSITEMAVVASRQDELNKIHSKWPYFNRDEYLRMTRKHLKKEELLTFYDKHILHGRCLILQVHRHGARFLKPSFEYTRVIHDTEKFRKSLHFMNTPQFW